MFRSYIKILPQFVKMVLNECDISKLDLGINKTQTNILMSVDENSEKSMSEISLLIGLEKSSFTRSVDYLVKKGLLVRKFPEEDRRKIMLSLTDKGSKAVKIIRKNLDVYLESLLSDFSEKDKSELFNSLKVLSKYMVKILEGNQK
jgi:DNA-binding MarR family transcriptional regulator